VYKLVRETPQITPFWPSALVCEVNTRGPSEGKMTPRFNEFSYAMFSKSPAGGPKQASNVKNCTLNIRFWAVNAYKKLADRK